MPRKSCVCVWWLAAWPCIVEVIVGGSGGVKVQGAIKACDVGYGDDEQGFLVDSEGSGAF